MDSFLTREDGGLWMEIEAPRDKMTSRKQRTGDPEGRELWQGERGGGARGPGLPLVCAPECLSLETWPGWAEARLSV